MHQSSRTGVNVNPDPEIVLAPGDTILVIAPMEPLLTLEAMNQRRPAPTARRRRWRSESQLRSVRPVVAESRRGTVAARDPRHDRTPALLIDMTMTMVAASGLTGWRCRVVVILSSKEIEVRARGWRMPTTGAGAILRPARRCLRRRRRRLSLVKDGAGPCNGTAATCGPGGRSAAIVAGRGRRLHQREDDGDARTGTEQLLLTGTWDDALCRVDFRPLAGNEGLRRPAVISSVVDKD